MSPASPFHETLVRVRYAETDQMGVAHHSAYIVYFELGRTDMMRAHGLSYARMERRGILLAVAEVGLKYRAPARFDETLRVRTRLTEVGRVRVQFDYEILRENEEVVCTGFTVLACVDRDLRPRRLPEEEQGRMLSLCRLLAKE